MYYIKLLISSLVVMFIAAVAIWAGVFILLFSLITAPILAWWVNRKLKQGMDPVKTDGFPETETKASYKIIEAEYEIVDKK